MGPAKASLEALVRGLSQEYGAVVASDSLAVIPVVLIGELLLDLPGWDRRGAITLGEWIGVRRRFLMWRALALEVSKAYRPMATGEDIAIEPICSSSSSYEKSVLVDLGVGTSDLLEEAGD
jgi:hypothetical protein